MYLLKIDHLTYERRGGGGFTLPEALRELHGVGNAAILRLDGTVAVAQAGSATALLHAPTGRTVTRRPTRRSLIAAAHAAGDQTALRTTLHNVADKLYPRYVRDPRHDEYVPDPDWADGLVSNFR